MTASPCDHLAEHLRERYQCSPQGDYVRVRTPLLYPDGDVIDVFVPNEADAGFVSDLGETTAWLGNQSTSARRSPKQTALINDVCLTLGVEFRNGMLNSRFAGEQTLADAIDRVSQAAVRVSDLWFTFRSRTVQSVTDEVAEYLTGCKIVFERRQKIPGRSGRVWPIDFRTRTRTRSALVQVLSTGNRAAAHQQAEHVLASWYDLSQYKIGPQGTRFVSLFDDTSDVWSEEEFSLVGDLSDIAYWSRPDNFSVLLSDTA